MHKYAQLLTMIFSIFKMLVKTYQYLLINFFESLGHILLYFDEIYFFNQCKHRVMAPEKWKFKKYDKK